MEASKATRSDAPPRWSCQSCKHPFIISGAEAFMDRVISGAPSLPGTGSVLAASKMDHSFVVLPKQRNPGYPPPRPRSSGVHLHKDFANAAAETHRNMDGSFVVLPSAAASIYRYEPVSNAQPSGASAATVQHTSNASFNANVNVLTKVFEIAATQTQLDQPLCVECMRLLTEELDKELEETNCDIKQYQACIDRLEQEQKNAISDDELAKEILKLEEEERKLEAEIEQVEKENLQHNMHLEILDSKSKTLEALEQSFWHEVNDFNLQLNVHQEERDAVLAKIDVAQAQLTMLKKTNVLNDAFYISKDGEFGTINNFRLCFSNSQVEWDEINAAWGQACLLLYTLARYCHLNFTYRIIPMGSYPSIADSKNTYELYGPVNLFWSSKYDKAKQYFLACLREFAEFAHAKDKLAKATTPFELPYKIENDKVNGLPIARTFNQQENSAAVLKYTLCNLKWALFWVMASTTFHPAPSITNNSNSSSSRSQLQRS